MKDENCKAKVERLEQEVKELKMQVAAILEMLPQFSDWDGSRVYDWLQRLERNVGYSRETREEGKEVDS